MKTRSDPVELPAGRGARRWQPVALALLVTLAALLVAPPADAVEKDWFLVTRVAGTVETRTAQAPRWSKVFISRLMFAGDWVRVSSDGQGNVRLFDETVIKLGPGTVAKLDEVVLTPGRQSVAWTVLAGEARVQRLARERREGVTSNFKLSTPVAHMGVDDQGRSYEARCEVGAIIPKRGTDEGPALCDFDAEVPTDPGNVLIAGSAGGAIALSTYAGDTFRSLSTRGVVIYSTGVPAIDFSPDGRRVAFVMSESLISTGGQNVWVMNIDGSGLTRVTAASDTESSQGSTRHTFESPAWSPDGRRLAFTHKTSTVTNSPPATSASGAIEVASVGGGVPAGAAEPGGYSYDINSQRFMKGVDWSVDGKLVFVCRTGNQICVDGRPVYTSPRPGELGQVYAPVWSPDGTRIAFAQWEDVDTGWSVHTVDADGKNDSGLWTGQDIAGGFHIYFTPGGEDVLAWCGYCSGRQVLGVSPFLRTVVRVNSGEVEVSRRDDLAGASAGSAARARSVVVKAGQEAVVDARRNKGFPLKPVSFDAPEVLELKGPEDGSSQGKPPTLGWQAFPGTDHYLVTLVGPVSGRQPGPASTARVSGRQTSASLAKDWPKMARGEWQWRVEAADAEGNVLAASEWWRFRKR